MPPEPPPEASPRRRWPGPAVLLVLLYAVLFAAGLWWMRGRSPLFRRPTAGGRPAEAARSAPKQDLRDRDALKNGAGLVGAAREEYQRRIATECCSCGCDLSLERCLATERTCPESPPRAAAIFEELR